MKVGDLVEHKQPWEDWIGVVIMIDTGDPQQAHCKVQWAHGKIDWYPVYHLWKVTDESR